MPPKKKKSGKKKKGKKSGKKSAKGTPGQPQEQLNELGKEFFLVQIRDLENRLARYQKKCDELEVGNGQFREKYDQLTTDKKDIVKYLKKQLEQRGDEISDLNDRLIGLQQAKDTEKEQYEMQLQQLRTEFQETKDQLTSENMILGGKLASLEEFKVQKEDLMAKFAAMEEDLRQQDENHKDVIYNLERKQVVDKDRLKKEMVMRVNQVAAEFRKVSNKQMAETTKRTIRENVSINSQLAKMSDKTMENIADNDELRAKDKKQRQQIDLLESNEKELAKKNHSNQKIIRMLTEKCQTQESMLLEYEARENEFAELQSEADLLRQQIESSRSELEGLAKENELLEEELGRVQQTGEDMRKSKRKLETVLAECAAALQVALQPSTSEDVEETEQQRLEKRDNLLENLLVLLNSAAALGVGPTPGNLASIVADQNRTRSASSMPGSGKGIKRGELPMSPLSASAAERGTLPHYQLGDLGLIPRPAHHIPTSFDKMKDSSNTSRLNNLKRVLTRSVAVQTNSSPKAMFFADQLLSRMPHQNTHVLQELQVPMKNRASIPPLASAKTVPNKVF